MDRIKLSKKKINNRNYCIMKCLICDKKFPILIGKFNNDENVGKTCSRNCRNKLHKIIMTGRKASIRTRQKMSAIKKMNPPKSLFRKGNKTWNTGLTKKIDKRLANVSKVAKKMNSDGMIGMKNKKHSKATKIKMSFSNRTDETSNYGIGDYYRNRRKKIWMRSSYEIKFARYPDKNNIEWKYEPKKFILSDKTYLPDFYVKNWKCWVEIKGWYHEKDKARIRQFRREYPKIKLIVLTQNILKNKYNLDV